MSHSYSFMVDLFILPIYNKPAAQLFFAHHSCPVGRQTQQIFCPSNQMQYYSIGLTLHLLMFEIFIPGHYGIYGDNIV